MKLLIGIFMLSLLGCAAMQSRPSLTDSFHLIKRGDTPDVVIKKVGQPKKINGTWYYFGKNQKEIKSEIYFSTNKKVESLTVYPQQEGDEDQLQILLLNTFKDLSFIHLKKISCQKPYYFSNEFYINKENGIVIRYNTKRQFVDYYAYQSLEDINNLEEAFNKCLLKM